VQDLVLLDLRTPSHEWVWVFVEEPDSTVEVLVLAVEEVEVEVSSEALATMPAEEDTVTLVNRCGRQVEPPLTFQ